MQGGLDFFVSLQEEDGSWRGDYGGPMFLLPMYIAACHVANHEIPATTRQGMVAYLRNTQNPDGGIGLHAEDSGSMFTTALSYVALRMLGVEQKDPAAIRMRRWIHENGTALGAASWGKLILAVLNLYPYEGLNPILPELWLLPYWTPIHPGRLWCHCRQVYLPMAYLYGKRAAATETDFVRELRVDLYDRPYDTIDFTRHRDTVAPSDNRVPVAGVLRAANRVMGVFERRCPPLLRGRALGVVLEHIRYEDAATHHIDIGPVNSVLNALVHHFEDPGGVDCSRSFAALEGYLCHAPDGVKFNGYNSTALWDTAFATQAILSTPLASLYRAHLWKADSYIRGNQVLEDVPDKERYFRHASRGGWPFSDREHGWPITDCTAEGFKSVLGLEPFALEPVDEELLQGSVELILSWQNRDGGWASYEKQRGGAWLELLNPSQIFSDIMVDYSYVECSSACIQALAAAKRRFPGGLARRIDRAIERGTRFIEKKQRPDGGWQGSWGICFTYGAWFGVSGLVAAGRSLRSAPIRAACGFLLARQNRDGGFGERPESCTRGRYVRDEKSRVAHTAWALLTLVRAGLADTAAAKRAVDFLTGTQLGSGDWPPDPLVGVFNKTTLINYEHYRRYFPIWALAEFEQATNLSFAE